MILLGVTGSIAAYKAAEILRLLIKAGEDVHVMMTPAATAFVGPLTFSSLSGHPVMLDTMNGRGGPVAVEDSEEGQIAHLDLPKRASVILVAPASADTMSRLAAGSAGDIVSASLLAVPREASGKLKVPVFLAPAMHEAMWKHPATQANVERLRAYGYQLIGPVRGDLSRAKDSGDGRLTDPKEIVETLLGSR